MIPHTIHYCWFGGTPLPELAEKCIASWHQHMPDWEYHLWNEDNFSINDAPMYVQEAYAAKKYAFVSDYVRLWALEKEGGVYLDTDVEVIRSLDDLLEQVAFCGFEESKAHLPASCVIGTIPHAQWLAEMLALYDNISFIKADGLLDTTTNVQRIGAVLCSLGLMPNGKEQILHLGEGEWLHIYPYDYFCPITSTRVLRKTSNTYTIHYYMESWHEKNNWCRLQQIVVGNRLFRECVNGMVIIKRRLFD